MAKGHEAHQQRSRALSMFGKDLTRRAHSRCELCEAGGQSLQAFELPPVPELPQFQRCLFLCADCAGELSGRKITNVERWRCLNNSLWSEIPAVQAGAVIILRRLEKNNLWARELLEQAYLSEECKELLCESAEQQE